MLPVSNLFVHTALINLGISKILTSPNLSADLCILLVFFSCRWQLCILNWYLRVHCCNWWLILIKIENATWVNPIKNLFQLSLIWEFWSTCILKFLQIMTKDTLRFLSMLSSNPAFDLSIEPQTDHSLWFSQQFVKSAVNVSSKQWLHIINEDGYCSNTAWCWVVTCVPYTRPATNPNFFLRSWIQPDLEFAVPFHPYSLRKVGLW